MVTGLVAGVLVHVPHAFKQMSVCEFSGVTSLRRLWQRNLSNDSHIPHLQLWTRRTNLDGQWHLALF